MNTTTTKGKILKAALELLEKSGIKAVTQPAVAKVVGISQGQLTYHFPKRSDLVLAVTDMALDRIATVLFSQAAKNPEKTLEKLAPMLWRFLSDTARTRALLGLVSEADENEEVRARLASQEKRARVLISAALGLEEEDADVTLAHALLVGFAVISFLRNDSQKELEKEFYSSLKKFRSQLPKKKGK